MELVKLDPGVYEIPDEQYFQIDAASNSDLKILARSPAHYRYYKDNPGEQKTSPEMLQGRALHSVILEPETFFNKYAILPADAPPRPTAAQMNAANPTALAIERIEFYNEFEERNEGKVIITAEQCDEYLYTGETVRKHPELAAFLNGGMAERTVLAIDPETGLMCRCRTDYAVKVNGQRILVDLKSAEDARPDAFQRAAYNYRYFTQAAFYSDVWEWAGYPIDLWIFAIFEKDPPYAVKLYEVLPADMERGRGAYRAALNTLAECKKTGEWPAYPTDIEPLHYPAWAKD